MAKSKSSKVPKKAKKADLVKPEGEIESSLPEEGAQPETAAEFNLVVGGINDPVGACVWYDNTNQPHCTTTTQSLCKAKKGSRFYPNQACP